MATKGRFLPINHLPLYAREQYITEVALDAFKVRLVPQLGRLVVAYIDFNQSSNTNPVRIMNNDCNPSVSIFHKHALVA